MATMTLKARIKVAWWLRPYFWGVATMAAITGLEPNIERVNYWINRAITVELSK